MANPYNKNKISFFVHYILSSICSHQYYYYQLTLLKVVIDTEIQLFFERNLVVFPDVLLFFNHEKPNSQNWLFCSFFPDKVHHNFLIQKMFSYKKKRMCAFLKSINAYCYGRESNYTKADLTKYRID